MTTVNRLIGTVFLVILCVGGKESGVAQNSFLGEDHQIFSQTPTNNTVNFALANPSICGLNFPILDNSCTASHQYQIMVSGITPDQLGINIVLEEVHFIIEHSWVSDLDITLRSPNNKVIELSTDNGGGADNYGDPSDMNCTNYTAFSMNACTPITEGSAPFIGTYLPEGDFNTFHDGSDPNGTWILQMCDDAADDDGQLIFVELVFSTVVCEPVTNLTVEDFDSTAAVVSWDSGDCINTIIEYGPPGFVPGSGNLPGGGTVLSAACPVNQPFTINGLSELTEYEIYVRTECTAGAFTKNSCPVSFKTDCSTPPPSLFEDFDSQASCATSCTADCPLTGIWQNSADDDFDWLVDSGGTVSSQTGPSDDISGGGNYIYIETSGSACQSGNFASLVSNCLEINAASDNCHLSFYYHMYGATVNTLNVDISTDEGLSWINLWSLSGNQGNEWFKAFVNLSAFDGMIAKLRFTASGGSNFRSDIAIDNIQLYGPVDLGLPAFEYYLDNDGDQFGDINFPLHACAASPPGNYVDNALDCNDNDPAIHPDADEIPCNAIDENCNGFDDDSILPEPAIDNPTICSGTAAVMSGSGNLYWYDSPAGGTLLHTGNSFDTGILTENATYYVLDSLNASCYSSRVPVSVAVELLPDLATNDEPEICQGDQFDLSTLNIIDFNQTNGTLTYHSSSPADPGNELSGTVVSPSMDQTYYILSTSPFGCTGELAVELEVNDLPEVTIFPSGIIQVCKNGSEVVSAFQTGPGFPPFSYEWTNGATTQQTAISASSPGNIETHFVTITDANACTATDFVAVQTIESITMVSTGTSDVSTCNGNDGTISVTPLDGIAPYQITWNGPVSGSVSNVTGTYIIQNLEQGTYSLEISDNSNPGLDCHINLPFVIVNGPSAIIDPNIVITDVDCNGSSTGGIDITVTGNSPAYLWSNGATSQDLQNLAAGFYDVTITDGTCSNLIENIEVTEPEEIDFIFESFPVSCFNGNDGSIFINVSGGTTPFSIEWSNGQFGESNEGLTAGDYTFTVTDANHCIFESLPLAVAQSSAISINLEDSENPSCFSAEDGSLEISVTGGNPGYTYLWNNGSVSQDIDDLAGGTYSVTVTDINNCSSTAVFDLDAPPAMSYNTIEVVPPTCNALNDGFIDLEIVGGTPPYEFFWNSGEDTDDIFDLGEGDYQLLVRDANDCEILTETFVLTAPELMDIIVNEKQNNFCQGLETGFIEITVNGGTAPYTYLWSNGATTQDIANLEAGIYQLTVTDFNACTIVSSDIIIADNEALHLSLNQLEHISCPDETDGSLLLSVTGGLWPYDFFWNNGDETEYINNLSTGVYVATVVDANGCLSVSDTFIIIEPGEIAIEVISVEHATCNGFENGGIDVQVSGGTGTYFFSWNDGSTEEDLQNAPEGAYLLTVLDDNGCIAESETIQVGAPEVIDIILDSVIHIGCANTLAGSIDIKISGGIQPYTYQWDSGQTTQDLDGIPSGFYSVTVTDQNGCTGLLSSIEVEQLDDGFPVELAIVNDVSCHGANDGSIEITLDEGTGPYQYNWSNGIVQTAHNENLPGGLYNVTVTDDNGCIGESPWFEVFEPAPLTYYAPTIVHNECFGTSEGIIGIEIQGGTAPYTVNWNNGDTGMVILDLPAAMYDFMITDANACTIEANAPIAINQPDSGLAVDTLSVQDVACFGQPTGAIVLTASGGTGSYNYQWNTGASGPVLNQIIAGHYTCTVSDLSNCPDQVIEVEVTEPDAPLMVDSVAVVDVYYCNDTTGSIALHISGGTPPYAYFWNTGSMDSSLEDLGSGNYVCTVTDANSCFINTQAYFIDSPLDDISLEGFSTPDTINGSEDGTATIIVNGGTPPFLFQWDENTGSQVDSVATGLAAGVYFVTVTDSRNCTEQAFVEVSTITSLSENQIIYKLELYPNPTTGLVNLNLSLKQHAEIELEIFSFLGQPLFELRSRGAELNSLIDLDQYPAGVYLLSVKVGGLHYLNRKIILSP